MSKCIIVQKCMHISLTLLFVFISESARARRESASNKTRLVYNTNEHPYGLLPPPYHCGKYLRCRKVPFQLPHDLWWQHTHSQLPGRDLVPSWNYRKIRTSKLNNINTVCETVLLTNVISSCVYRCILCSCSFGSL